MGGGRGRTGSPLPTPICTQRSPDPWGLRGGSDSPSIRKSAARLSITKRVEPGGRAQLAAHDPPQLEDLVVGVRCQCAGSSSHPALGAVSQGSCGPGSLPPLQKGALPCLRLARLWQVAGARPEHGDAAGSRQAFPSPVTVVGRLSATWFRLLLTLGYFLGKQGKEAGKGSVS